MLIPMASPPADIAADPGRLKMWQDERAESREHTDYSRHIVEVRGCGKHVFYECCHPSSESSRGQSGWMCQKKWYLPTSTW